MLPTYLKKLKEQLERKDFRLITQEEKELLKELNEVSEKLSKQKSVMESARFSLKPDSQKCPTCGK